MILGRTPCTPNRPYGHTEGIIDGQGAQHKNTPCTPLARHRQFPAPWRGFQRKSGDPSLHVREDNVEATAYRPATYPAAGSHIAHAVAKLNEFHLRDGTDTDLDQVAQNLVVLLQNADDRGIPKPPLPGLPVVVAVLTARTAVFSVLSPIGEWISALQAVWNGFL